MIKESTSGHFYSGSLIDVQPLYNMNAMRSGGRNFEKIYAREVMLETIKELEETVNHFKKELGIK